MSKLSYYISIDYLRTIAAILISYYHFVNFESSNGALFEVDHPIRTSSHYLSDVVFVFFLISGFIIPLSMQRQHFKLSKFAHFLLRRWVRIEIPYVGSIGLILLIGLLWSLKSGIPYEINGWQVMHHLTYTTAFSGFDWLNKIYWTLAIEFQFYVIIALIFPLLFSKNTWIRYSTLLLFGASFLLFEDLRMIFRYAPLFTLGILYLFYSTEPERKTLHLILMVVFLVATWFSLGLSPALYTAAALLVIHLMNSVESEPFNAGKTTYSFYLTHGAIGGTIVYFANNYVENTWLKFGTVLLAIIASFVFSAIYYRLIELPSQRLSRKITISSELPSEHKPKH